MSDVAAPILHALRWLQGLRWFLLRLDPWLHQQLLTVVDAGGSVARSNHDVSMLKYSPNHMPKLETDSLLAADDQRHASVTANEPA